MSNANDSEKYFLETDMLSTLVPGTTLGTERVPVIVEPSQELSTIPVRIRCFPLTIRPQHIRTVFHDELIKGWHHLILTKTHKNLSQIERNSSYTLGHSL